MTLIGSAIIVIAVSVLLFAQDRRYASVSLGTHYLGLALLLEATQNISIALSEAALGITAAALLWFSQPPRAKVEAPHEKDDLSLALDQGVGVPPEIAVTPEKLKASDEGSINPFFQLLTLLLCGTSALALSTTYQIGADAGRGDLSFAFYWLAIAGIMAISLVRVRQTILLGVLFILEAVQLAYLGKASTAQLPIPLTLAALQLAITFAIARPAALGDHKQHTLPSDNVEQNLLIRLIGVAPSVLGVITIEICFLGLMLLLQDAFLSAVLLTGMGLALAILYEQDAPKASLTNGTKLLASMAIAGTCLQLAVILATEFQVSREPLLGRTIVGLIALGLLIFSGTFPFHWWLVELPRRFSPLTAAIIAALIGGGTLRFVFQMSETYPWLLSDQRSQLALMAIGVVVFCAATLLAFSVDDITSLMMLAFAANGGVIIAGIASDSLGGRVGAAATLAAEALAFLLLLTFSQATHSTRKTSASVHVEHTVVAHHLIGAISFVLGALMLLGLPPTPGFIGRWLILVAVAGTNTYLALLAVVGSVVSLISFAPLFQWVLAIQKHKAQDATANGNRPTLDQPSCAELLIDRERA